jgi:integrase/recombinase XerC
MNSLATAAAAATPSPVFPDADRRRRLLEAWLDGRSATTVRAYKGDLAHFARWAGRPDAAAAADWLFSLDAGAANLTVLEYKNAMMGQGLAPASASRRLAALRSLARLARLTGVCGWSIEVDDPPVERLRDTAGPGKAGWAAIKSTAAADDSPRGLRDRALVVLLHDLGLRRAESVNLAMEHVEHEAGVPSAVWVLGKGRRDRQRLTLAAPTARALAAWLAVRGPAEGPVFHRLDNASQGDASAPLTGEAVRLIVGRLGREAGLEGPVRPHGLRHQAITAALDAGHDLRTVQRFSRHAHVQMLITYDDNRTDMAGMVSRTVAGE